MKGYSRMRNITGWSLAAIGALTIMNLILVSCGGGGGDGGGGSSTVQLVACPGSGTTNVTIQDFSFTPSNTSIAVNSIVKWTNNAALTTHTVTSTTVPTNGSFNSGNLSPAASVCYQFTAAGTYHYECSIHTQMTGIVVVQ